MEDADLCPGEFTSTVQLVRAAQGGDRRALEDLFERYLPRVQQIVALRMGRRLRQFVELEDIAQEVVLKAFQDLGRFEKKTEGSFRNWLARRVESEVVDHARIAASQKRGGGRARRFGDWGGEGPLASIFAGEGPTPSEAAQAREAEESMEAALLRLPKHYREVIVLRHLCEMSYADISETMSFGSDANARKAVSRALAKLKETLGR